MGGGHGWLWVTPGSTQHDPLLGRVALGTGEGRQLYPHMSRDPPGWTTLQLHAHLPAFTPVLGAPELQEPLGRHLGSLGANEETAQGLGSCQSVGEQHGLPGTLPGSGEQVREGWAVGAVVLTPAVLEQTGINSTNQSGAQACVK